MSPTWQTWHRFELLEDMLTGDCSNLSAQAMSDKAWGLEAARKLITRRRALRSGTLGMLILWSLSKGSSTEMMISVSVCILERSQSWRIPTDTLQ